MRKIVMELKFYSMWGNLITDYDGYVLRIETDEDENNKDPEDYLSEIKRMDVFEMRQFFRKNKLNDSNEHDILEAGFWSGETWDYEKSDEDWRNEIFLNKEIRRLA